MFIYNEQALIYACILTQSTVRRVLDLYCGQRWTNI